MGEHMKLCSLSFNTDMKKILFILCSLAAIVSCKQKATVVEGTVKGGNGDPVLISTVWNFGRDTVAVNPDGTFRLEKEIPEYTSAAIQVGNSKRLNFYIIPGKVHHLDVDLTTDPVSLSNTGAGVEESEFYNYFSSFNSLTGYEFPSSFKEHSDNFDARCAEALEKVNALSSGKSRRFFTESVLNSRDFMKFTYIWQVQKRGQRLDSDPDFNSFFDSIDLSKERNQKSFLSNMIVVKTECREQGTDYSLAYLDAIDQLAPTQVLRDSLKKSYAVKSILNGEVFSAEGGEALLAVVDAALSDADVLKDYHARVEKAISLLPGNDWLDFELLDLDQKTVKLSDFKGKVVYIDFWASWCIPCCLQIPYMKVLADKYAGAEDVATISVSFDDSYSDMLKALVHEPQDWPQYKTADSGKTIMNLYGFRAIPRFMIFDKNGKIVSVDAPRPQSFNECVALIEGAR